MKVVPPRITWFEICFGNRICFYCCWYINIWERTFFPLIVHIFIAQSNAEVYISSETATSLKNGYYDSAIGWVVFNLFARAGLGTIVARAGINTEQRKRYSPYSLMNVGK